MSWESSRGPTLMWSQLFERISETSLGLQGRIRQMFVSAILSGHIPPGSPVPSSRQLSDQLAIARNTVVFAYQQLVSEGYLQSRQRSGHFVAEKVLEGRLRAEGCSHASSPEANAWNSRLRFRPSMQRNISKPANWQKYPYPFLYGQFDAELFPTTEWRECCSRALSTLDIRSWAPDLITHDDPELIEQLRTQVLPRRGVWADADEIVITVGAQHALYLLADLLINQETVVGIEDPGYPDARNIIAGRTPYLYRLPIDKEGLEPTARIRECDYIFVTPSHQCPTTVTMPIDRREELLALAHEADCMIIEDDFESENRYGNAPIPALKSLDRNGRVIYVGSLSKSFAPGLRIGYVVAPRELIVELRALRRLMLRHPSAYIQRAFALFISLGHHHALLRRQSQAYQERAEQLGQALNAHLPEFQHIRMSGGSACWIRGPEWLNTRLLARAALDQGVVLEPGDIFFEQGPHIPLNYIRLGFNSIVAKKIEPGIARLAEVVRQAERSAARTEHLLTVQA